MGPADEFHSPYIYVGNNPMKLIKPDGVKVLMPTKLWSNTTFRNDAINSKQFQSQVSLRGKVGPFKLSENQMKNMMEFYDE